MTPGEDRTSTGVESPMDDPMEMTLKELKEYISAMPEGQLLAVSFERGEKDGGA